MTDNEIIKALECCSKSTCDGCEFGNQCDGFTPINLALSLINRQKAEIERLKSLVNFVDDTADAKVITINGVSEDVKEMGVENDEKD